MQLRRKHATTPPAQSEADRLGSVRPHTHDPDERPSREDRGYGSTIFTRPVVPLPGFMRGRKKPPS